MEIASQTRTIKEQADTIANLNRLLAGLNPKADQAEVLADANKRLKDDLDQLTQEHATMMGTLRVAQEKQAENEQAVAALNVRVLN